MTLEMEARSGRPILPAVKRAGDGGRLRDRRPADVATWARELLVDIFVIGARTLTVDVAGFRSIAPARPPLLAYLPT